MNKLPKITFVIFLFVGVCVAQTPEKNLKGYVISIRKVDLILDSISDTPETKTINKYVEIRIKQASKFGITNASQYFRIGVQEFFIQGYSDDMAEAWFMLTPKEFENLEDGALILFRQGQKMTSEQIKNFYDEYGEPKESETPNFGRLDKSMIEKFPIVVRKNVQD